MKLLFCLSILLLLSSCTQPQETNPLAKKVESLTFFQDLNQYFTLKPLPNNLLDSLRTRKKWQQFGGTTTYPILPKTGNQSGFLSSEYGNCSNLFLVRQKHASGGGGHYDILFTLHPETGELIDQIIVGEESYLTTLRHQTIWVAPLDNYVFHVYGMDKIDSLTVDQCLEINNELACQHPISRYFFVDDNWNFQPIKTHKISNGRRFPFLSNQFLEAYAFNNYDKETLQLMSAEIYAQYGYTFKDSELQAYFNQQKWYHAQTLENIEELFSSFERHNLELIQSRISN